MCHEVQTVHRMGLFVEVGYTKGSNFQPYFCVSFYYGGSVSATFYVYRDLNAKYVEIFNHHVRELETSVLVNFGNRCFVYVMQ